MKQSWNFEECVSVFNKEIELLKNIRPVQENVRQAVINREWIDFDKKMGEVNRLGAEFNLLEEERELLFSVMDGDGAADSVKKPFSVMIKALPFEEQRELSRLYRELKTETLKIRVLNETFLAYLAEAKNVTASYLEAVCPARGGKLYTRKGRKVSQDLKSIVFNSRF